jgi:hypothetical protein
MAKTDELDYSDYFTGGVPAGTLFALNVGDAEEALRTAPESSHGLDQLAGISFIGLLAYFEAFCRDHFASLLNICPQLVHELKAKGRDVSVDASVLLSLKGHPRSHIGFLLAERYDFGTAKSVNSLYTDLLLVTPFSSDEAANFERLLNDRNLLVHHGGIYTSRYASQTIIQRQTKQRIFFDSLVIRRENVHAAASFLSAIAQKTMNATQSGLIQYMADKGIQPGPVEKQAVDALVWW